MNRPAVILAVVVFALMSCDDDDACYLDLYTCEAPDIGHLNSLGEPDPCHREVDPCPGQCVPIPPAGWDSLPMLVWMGTELAPDCPARAGAPAFDGFMDLVEPDCPQCTCEPPTGECELPEILTANEEPFCASGITKDFLPNPWVVDEACNPTMNPVQAMSVTIGPLTMTETGCKPPGPPPPRDGAASWKTIVRACRGIAFPPCLDPSLLCVPTSEPPPPGFSQCIFQNGEHACPETYPVQRIAFQDVDDQRYCSSCGCEEPKGSRCTATVSVYQDGDCDQFADGSPVSNSGEQCMNLVPGVVTTIQGITSTEPFYEAGACEPSGGEFIGTAEILGTSTFCCLEE